MNHRYFAFKLVFAFLLVLIQSASSYAIRNKLRPFHDEKSCRQLIAREIPGWAPLQGSGEPERWTDDGHDLARNYDSDFKELYEVTGQTSIADLLRRRKDSKQTNHVLDLFGSGFFVADQSVADSITGVRWGEYDRAPRYDDMDEEIALLPPTPPEILGDIMNPHTWIKLRESMRKRSIPSLDMVAMRPMGGWQHSPFQKYASTNAFALYFIMENVLPLLSADGQFYFSIRVPFLRGDFRENPILQEMVRRIEQETDFHLSLRVEMTSDASSTYELMGVVYPK